MSHTVLSCDFFHAAFTSTVHAVSTQRLAMRTALGVRPFAMRLLVISPWENCFLLCVSFRTAIHELVKNSGLLAEPFAMMPKR